MFCTSESGSVTSQALTAVYPNDKVVILTLPAQKASLLILHFHLGSKYLFLTRKRSQTLIGGMFKLILLLRAKICPVLYVIGDHFEMSLNCILICRLYFFIWLSSNLNKNKQ